MGQITTNIFRISNLLELPARYDQYLIKGLNSTQVDYFKNRQNLQRQLSYRLQNPVLTIEQGGLPYLIVQNGSPYELPQSFVISGGKPVSFQKRFEAKTLNFARRSETDDEICLRFLQFAIQGEIRKNHELWQTQSGHPFYKKDSSKKNNGREQFSGFNVRPVITFDGGIGLCVDITTKTLSQYPLPQLISRNQFHRWKGKKCIYRYGSTWYEIEISSLGDTYADHMILLEDMKAVSLQKFITQNLEEPLPPEIANLSPETSVVVYYNNRNEERAAPTSLCYPIFGTDDTYTGQQHKQAILPPLERYEQILEVAEQYLMNLRIGSTPIVLDREPLTKPDEWKPFVVPDLRFGNNEILSVRGTVGAHTTTIQNLGKSRIEMLKNPKAGFYTSTTFMEQYLVLPTSVYRSWGKVFIEALRSEMKIQYPHDQYNPTVLYYDDSGKNLFVEQGRRLQKFITGRKWNPGFAIVMLHHTDDKRIREEDQLGAFVLDELRQQGVHGTIIHSETGKRCYEYKEDKAGKGYYVLSSDRFKNGQMRGYIRNVALNKVLLANSIWPFILETPLHADIIVGLDVKGTSASLLVVDKHGGKIRRSPVHKSKQKERLLEGQARKYFLEILRDELCSLDNRDTIRHIVAHIDGKAYESTIVGIRAAIEELKQAQELPESATITILEIAKSTMVSVRLFDISKNPTREIENSEVGEYYLCGQKEAYLCSTGRSFDHKRRGGTANPLQICYVEGELDFIKCIEDVYALTTLAWTRPEDCSRLPITTRLNDRFLREKATEYDRESLEYSYDN